MSKTTAFHFNRFMRFLLPILFVVFPLALAAQPAEEVRLTVNFTDTPLLEAIQHLEKKFGLIFSFPQAAVTGARVNCQFADAGWVEIEQCLFAANLLTCNLLDDGYVTLRPNAAETEKNWNFCLRIKGQDDTPLPFAPIGITRTGRAVSTDDQGRFSGNLRAAATDTLSIQYLGYAPLRVPLKDAVRGGCPSFTLVPASIELASVLVEEYLTDGVTATPDGRRVNFDPGQTPPLPGFAGTEVYRMLSLLPGVNNAGETAGDLNIRGGSRDQNLVLWDGIPVYTSGHYFGMISNFNAELIDQVSVWRGQAEAAYGGRISGVVKIDTDRTITKKLSAGAELNLLGVNSFVKAPLVRGKSDLHLGYTASLNGLLNAPTYQQYRAQVFQGDAYERILDADESTESFAFQELNGRWQYNFNDRQQLTLSGFAQQDDFSYSLTPSRFISLSESLNTRNAGGSLHYVDDLADGKKLEVQAAITDFSNRGNSQFIERRNQQGDLRSSSMQEASLRASYSFPLGKNGNFNAGFQLQQYLNALEFNFANTLADSLNQLNIRDAKAMATAVFGTWQWAPEGRPWRAELGLRLQHYSPTRQLYPEPRISGSYQLNKQWLLKAGYGENHQFPLEIITFNAQRVSATTPLWTLADGQRTQVLASREGSLGISGQPKGWLFDLEVYHKRVEGLSTLGSTVQNQGFLTGNSRSTGLDLLIKKRWGNLRTWAIYSLSKTEWRFPFPETSRQAETGYFPADNDRRHQLRLVNTWQQGPWSFSLGWRLHTGSRYTAPETVTIRSRPNSDPVIRLRQGPLNGATLPAFHRLDLSAFYDFSPKKPTGWRGRIGFSLLNLYNQDNVLERRYFVRLDPREEPSFKVEQLDKIGLALTPNVMVKIGF